VISHTAGRYYAELQARIFARGKKQHMCCGFYLKKNVLKSFKNFVLKAGKGGL
jgi:hypothetical protein